MEPPLNEISSSQQNENEDQQTAPLEQWEPQMIALKSIKGPVNLMDYILGGKSPEGRIFLETEPDMDPTNPAHRRRIIQTVRSSCAEAGFEVMCKGWEGGPKRMKFCCHRGNVYKNQKKDGTAPRQSITSKPLTKEEKCPFNFTLHWFPDHHSWVFKAGNGCRFHRGHGPEDLRTQGRCMDFATAMAPVVQELAALADAAPKAVDLRMRQELTALWHKYRDLPPAPTGSNKKPKLEQAPM
jgi:hypothetical protein